MQLGGLYSIEKQSIKLYLSNVQLIALVWVYYVAGNYYKFCRWGFNLQKEKLNPQEEEINPQEEKVSPQEEKMNLQEKKWTLGPGISHLLKFQELGQTGHKKATDYY